MIQPRQPSHEITIARSIVHDLLQPDPRVFWTDFIGSLIVGYTAGTFYLSAPLFSAVSLISFVIAALALYRLSLFMHEIVHFKKHEMRGFKIAWNVLAGIPMLTPSYFYESHFAHHNTHHYGTADDGEYLPLAHRSGGEVLLFLLQIFIQPLLVAGRFLLAPVTFLHPRLRRWTLERASSFVINFAYRRPITQPPHRAWTLMELACSLRIWLMVGLVLLGVNPWTRLLQIYALATVILSLNHLRTLGAHRYQNTGRRMSHEEQLLDSTNIRGGWLTELICPLGLRYHALHHLFPSLPYHNLGVAHRRLMQQLPDGAVYRQVEYPTFRAVLAEFFRGGPERAEETSVVTEEPKVHCRSA